MSPHFVIRRTEKIRENHSIDGVPALGSLAENIYELIRSGVVHSIFVRRDLLKMNQSLLDVFDSLHNFEPERTAVRKDPENVERPLVLGHDELRTVQLSREHRTR